MREMDRICNEVGGLARVVGHKVLEAEARVPTHKCNVLLFVEDIFQLVTSQSLEAHGRPLQSYTSEGPKLRRVIAEGVEE